MPKRGSCLGCLGGCLTKLFILAVIGVVCVWGLTVVMYPWALHIGGRSTPLLYWHGTGSVLSKDGKTYPLYLMFFPGMPKGSTGRLPLDGKRFRADLQGVGYLCVAPGNEERMDVSGSMYGAYSNATDNLFSFRLLEWRKPWANYYDRGFFDMTGMWRGQELVLDRPNEQGHPFKSGMLIDHATVTLRWADRSEFDAACRAMAPTAK